MQVFKATLAILLLAAITPLWAADIYKLRVDGLACAYCAYGIEKKFMRTEGVEQVDIDFEQGLVIVTTRTGLHFAEAWLREIVNDAGFTLRGVQVETREDQ